jgi:predicted nucleic acid-binding protein
VLVADASAIIEFLLQTELGLRIEERLYRNGDEIHLPHLLDVEVVSALRRIVRSGGLGANRAEEALEDLSLLRVIRHGHVDLVRRVWELRGSLTAYDATYIALAESLGATFLTCDRPLGAARGHSAKIEVMD